MVYSASDLGPEFEPRPARLRCVLRLINANQQIAFGDNLTKYWEVTCDGAVVIVQKPEISAGSDEPSGSCNYDWGRLYLHLDIH